MDALSLSILRARLVKNEGVSLYAYRDTRGFVTQGVGRLMSLNPAADPTNYPDIDMATAMGWLDADIAGAIAATSRYLPWFILLDGIRQGVLVEMVFQLGIDHVLGFAKMLDALQADDYVTASDEMLNSAWHKQTPARCEQLAEIMRTADPYAPPEDA